MATIYNLKALFNFLKGRREGRKERETAIWQPL